MPSCCHLDYSTNMDDVIILLEPYTRYLDFKAGSQYMQLCRNVVARIELKSIPAYNGATTPLIATHCEPAFSQNLTKVSACVSSRYQALFFGRKWVWGRG